MRASHARLAALAAALALSASGIRTASADTVPVQEIRLGLFGACMPTEQVGWVVGDLGRVYRTSDAGRTWARQEVVGRRPVFSISCTDDQHAWVSSTTGAIWRSEKSRRAVRARVSRVEQPRGRRSRSSGCTRGECATRSGGSTRIARWVRSSTSSPPEFSAPSAL